jgi:acetyl esterase/lipase
MYVEYPSTQEPALRLFASFQVPSSPKRILVDMHGWHGQVKKAHADNVAAAAPREGEWFKIAPEMRGRGDATGKPDCNGWELQDVIDAVEFAKREYADKVADPELITLHGGSGGGGNVYGLLGKFPDYFCRAHGDCGMSDYALWYRNDLDGEFRDELEGKGWIGGNPDDRPEAYASRGGLTTVLNLTTPLIVFHGETDIRVPSEQARRYVEKARRLGKGGLVEYHEFKGVGDRKHFGNITPEQESFRLNAAREFLGRDPQPLQLPAQGRLIVGGYVKAKRLEVILDSIDHVAAVDYDLEAGHVAVSGPSARQATVRIRQADGAWRESVAGVAACPLSALV